MRRLFILSLLLLYIGSVIFALTASNYKLDVLRTSGYSNLSQSDNYLKYSYLSDISRAAVDQISSLTKYTTFGQMDVSVFSAGSPYVVTMSLSKRVLSLGDSVTIDLEVSELLRVPTILIDDSVQLYNYDADTGHIYVSFQPSFSGERTYIINAILPDMGDISGHSVLSFNLYVDDGQDQLIQRLVTENMFGEVHVGRQKAFVNMFDLRGTNTQNIWDGLTINISQKDGLSLFDKAYLVESLSGRVIASSSVLPINQDLYLSISERTTLSIQNTRYEFFFDVKSSPPAGTTFNLSVVNFLSHQVSGIQKSSQTTGSIMSGMVKIVPQNQPIIMKAKIDDFTPSLDRITLDIEAEILQGPVNQIRFHLTDLTLGIQTATQTRPFTAVLISNDRYAMSNAMLEALQLTHNHQYVFVFELMGPANSSIVSSNSFRVDATPPNKPNSLAVQTYALNSSSLTGLRFIVDARSSLDPESGLRRYKIMQKASSTPVWHDIVSADVTSLNSIQIDYIENNNAINDYALMVQNGSGLWSVMSDVNEVDLRSNGTLIDTLFNSPNPFDSAHQRATTIYYSLRTNADVEMYIYDMYGYFIRKWHFASGSIGGQMLNAIDWDGTNQIGDKVSMGGYILIIKATDAMGGTMQKKYSIGVVR